MYADDLTDMKKRRFQNLLRLQLKLEQNLPPSMDPLKRKLRIMLEMLRKLEMETNRCIAMTKMEMMR